MVQRSVITEQKVLACVFFYTQHARASLPPGLQDLATNYSLLAAPVIPMVQCLTRRRVRNPITESLYRKLFR